MTIKTMLSSIVMIILSCIKAGRRPARKGSIKLESPHPEAFEDFNQSVSIVLLAFQDQRLQVWCCINLRKNKIKQERTKQNEKGLDDARKNRSARREGRKRHWCCPPYKDGS